MAKRRFRSRGRFRRRYRRRTGFKRFTRLVKRAVTRITEIKWSTSTNNLVRDAQLGLTADVTPTIGQGAGKNSRIGNRIRYKFLQFRLLMITSATATASLACYRFILWQPRMALDLTVTPTNLPIFQLNGNGAMVSPINNQNARILMDKTRFMGVVPNSNSVQLPAAIAIKKKVRVRNNVSYIDSASSSSLDPKDSYILTIISDITTTNQVSFAVRWSCRLSFVDF